MFFNIPSYFILSKGCYFIIRMFLVLCLSNFDTWSAKKLLNVWSVYNEGHKNCLNSEPQKAHEQ